MTKIKFIAGWFGEKNESVFFKSYEHPSNQLNLYLQTLIEKIKKNEFKKNIEIHFNSQFSLSKNNKYLILLEHPYIRPQNFFIFPKRYKKIFGCDLRLKNYKNFIYLKYPHFWPKIEKNIKRDIRYSMVCSNRNILIGPPKYSLYNKRQEIIDFCENIPKLDFNLYGSGWNNIHCKIGIKNRILQLLNKFGLISLERKNKLRNYRGIIKNKFQLLSNSKFNFCFENISNFQGYISEKIWDSIAAGSIPIYWPSWEIPEEYIPRRCYIDASKFPNFNALFNYLESITDKEIIDWSNMLIEFSKTKKQEVSIDNYSDIIIEQIKNDT